MKSFKLLLCGLLLAPFPALAQDEPAAEEPPATEAAPAEEQAPAGEAPAEATGEEAAPAGQPEVVEVAQEESDEPEEPLTGSYLDAFYVATTAYTEKPAGGLGATERGDGMGGRGMYRVFKWLAVTAEYEWRTLEDIDEEITETSVGLGATAQSNAGDLAGIFVEYDKFDSDLSELDGFSVHGRLMRQPTEWFSFYGDIGYDMLDDDGEDVTGIEYTIGMGFGFSSAKLFADWHFVDLEGKDSGDRKQLGDVRVGARFSF